MKKAVSLITVFLIVLSTFWILAPQTKSEPHETPLYVAEKAAAYVISQAMPENGGYKWPYPQDGYVFNRADIRAGAAGIGYFLLSLYEKTGNPTYLEYAKGATEWIISNAVPERGGYKWATPTTHNPSPGWWLSQQHRGVSGIGEFLLDMYQATANSTYLEYAKGAAQWLAAMAYYEYGGCFIPKNPPGKYGSQASFGIDPGAESFTVLFLLHMYQETGNSTYLTYVKGTAEWLISGIYVQAENGGYKWLYNYPYHTDRDWNFPRMDAQIACFFYEAYEATNNETYLEYANGALQWIISVAEEVGDGCKWDRRLGEHLYLTTTAVASLPTKFTTIADVLLMGYSITSNSTYLEYAQKFANWVISQGVAEDGGVRLPSYVRDTEGERYNAYVNSQAYRFLVDIYIETGNSTYLDYTDKLVQWITFNATETNGGYKWSAISGDGNKYSGWWFERGAAGIGYYLISAPPPVSKLTATVDINPETLNLKSKGKWITAYIELPEGYDVSDVNVSTVLLNDTVPAETHPVGIGDEDGDGIPDLMVKFDRASVIDYIDENVDWSKPERTKPLICQVTLTITGMLYDGTPFEGSDTIRTLKFLKGQPQPK